MLTLFFVGGQIYEIALFGKTDGGTEGSSKRRVRINEPPQNGRCIAQPLAGEPLDPMFTLKCTGFEDDEKPFYYEFLYSTSTNGKDKKSLGIGLEESRSDITLPSGLEENDYNITLYARVSDKLGASREVEFESPITVNSSVAEI